MELLVSDDAEGRHYSVHRDGRNLHSTTNRREAYRLGQRLRLVRV